MLTTQLFDQSLPRTALSFQGDRQDPLTGGNCPDNASSPLMQNASKVGQAVVLFQFQHSKSDWQIKAGPFLAHIDWGQIDRESSFRSTTAARRCKWAR